MELLLSNMRDAGLENVTRETTERVVKKHGEDYVSMVVTNFKALRSKMTMGTSHNAGKGLEPQLGKAYQQLVRIGLCTQLKYKYRGGT